jgi:hypothetical protein
VATPSVEPTFHFPINGFEGWGIEDWLLPQDERMQNDTIAATQKVFFTHVS